jgi:hypothetical protein
MDPRDDEKQIEAKASAEVVPDLGKQANIDVERISSHLTIAAASAGLISDGCESPCTAKCPF